MLYASYYLSYPTSHIRGAEMGAPVLVKKIKNFHAWACGRHACASEVRSKSCLPLAAAAGADPRGSFLRGWHPLARALVRALYAVRLERHCHPLPAALAHQPRPPARETKHVLQVNYAPRPLSGAVACNAPFLLSSSFFSARRGGVARISGLGSPWPLGEGPGGHGDPGGLW